MVSSSGRGQAEKKPEIERVEWAATWMASWREAAAY
jgi:hypothetical protein